MAFSTIEILMIDDSPSDRLMTKKAFEQSRVINTIHFAEDGESGFEWLEDCERKPSLILLDLNMPGMDGHEFLENIKKNPELCSIPVVILTSSVDGDDIARSYLHQCAGYIRKPVTIDGLLTVASTIENYWFAIVERPQGQ